MTELATHQKAVSHFVLRCQREFMQNLRDTGEQPATIVQTLVPEPEPRGSRRLITKVARKARQCRRRIACANLIRRVVRVRTDSQPSGGSHCRWRSCRSHNCSK